MVKEIKFRFNFFQCEECGYVYKDKELAKKCETWCKDHHSCNIEIIKQGIPVEKVTRMAKYKCPKCKMEYEAPGKCEMCSVELEEVKEE